MRGKYLLISLVSLGIISSLIFSTQTMAHVLITDTSRSQGAILHIIPDDDPVAGERATLYFDTQPEFLDAKSTVTLTVQDANGVRQDIATRREDSLVTADYTFVSQGLYNIRYSVQTKGVTYIFEQSQRVTRGATAQPADKPAHIWAEVLVVISVMGLLCLFVIAFNNRRNIAHQSKLG